MIFDVWTGARQMIMNGRKTSGELGARSVLSRILFLIATGLFSLMFIHLASAQHVALDLDALSPFAAFQECEVCPEMIVLPMGQFVMGGPPGESRLNIHWDAGNIRPVTPEDPYIAEQEGPLRLVSKRWLRTVLFSA